MRWFGLIRRSRPTPPVAGPDDSDPYAPYQPQFRSYLEQARWLLEQQQRRSQSFQQTAVAMIGFDGVLLALLVSSGALRAAHQQVPWGFTVAAALALALSSLAGVATIVPRYTDAVGAAQTVEAWATFKQVGGWDQSTEHFAEMLLAADPPLEGKPGPAERVASWFRALARRPEPPRQPLLAATRLASVRGRWAGWSGALLAAGVTCLAVALVVGPAPAPTPAPARSTAPAVQGTTG